MSNLDRYRQGAHPTQADEPAALYCRRERSDLSEFFSGPRLHARGVVLGPLPPLQHGLRRQHTDLLPFWVEQEVGSGGLLSGAGLVNAATAGPFFLLHVPDLSPEGKVEEFAPLDSPAP